MAQVARPIKALSASGVGNCTMSPGDMAPVFYLVGQRGRHRPAFEMELAPALGKGKWSNCVPSLVRVPSRAPLD